MVKVFIKISLLVYYLTDPTSQLSYRAAFCSFVYLLWLLYKEVKLHPPIQVVRKTSGKHQQSYTLLFCVATTCSILCVAAYSCCVTICISINMGNHIEERTALCSCARWQHCNKPRTITVNTNLSFLSLTWLLLYICPNLLYV